jgi:hypothetical protein
LKPAGEAASGSVGNGKEHGHTAADGMEDQFDAAGSVPDRDAVSSMDLTSRGGVLDMDASLVRDVLARVQELLAQADADGSRDEEEEAPGSGSGKSAIVIDLPTQTVWRSGRPVRVTPTEFRLLVALVRRRGAVVSRKDLRREVWPDGTEVRSRVIDSHIARLRRKLEHDPKQPRHILTALAAGYRFLA